MQDRRKRLAQNILHDKNPGSTTKNTLTKLWFRVEGQIKSFLDKNKLKEFITTKTVLQKMLKGLLLRRKNMYQKQE